jgi:hypothetical protein
VDSIGTEQGIWDENAAIVAALLPDDLAAGESVNTSLAAAFR